MIGRQTKARHRKKDMKEINGIQFETSSNLKETYRAVYPTDTLGNSLDSEITLADVFARMMKGENIYRIIFADKDKFDSIVRERVFEMLALAMECDYNDIYNLWIEFGNE